MGICYYGNRQRQSRRRHLHTTEHYIMSKQAFAVTKPLVLTDGHGKTLHTIAGAIKRCHATAVKGYDALFSDGVRFAHLLEPYREKKDGSGMTGDPRSVSTPETHAANLRTVGEAFMGSGTIFAKVTCQGVSMTGAAWCEYTGSLTADQKKVKNKMKSKRSRYLADVREAVGTRAGMTAEEMQVQGGGRGTKKGAQQSTGPADSAESKKTDEAQIIDALNLALKKMRDAGRLAFDPTTPADLVREALTIIVNASK